MNGTENVNLHCPYCDAAIEIVVDCSAGNQNYIEDCEVCCQPMRLQISLDSQGVPSVSAAREDDA